MWVFEIQGTARSRPRPISRGGTLHVNQTDPRQTYARTGSTRRRACRRRSCRGGGGRSTWRRRRRARGSCPGSTRGTPDCVEGEEGENDAAQFADSNDGVDDGPTPRLAPHIHTHIITVVYTCGLETCLLAAPRHAARLVAVALQHLAAVLVSCVFVLYIYTGIWDCVGV